MPTKVLTRQASAQRLREDTQHESTTLTKNNSMDYLKRYKDKEIQR